MRAGIVERAEDYPWSSYPVHALGKTDELIADLVTYEQLSPQPAARRRKWAEMVHRPIEERSLEMVRRSSATGLPFGDAAWVQRLAKRLDLDLTIRPRGRPRKLSEAGGVK